MPSKMKVQNAHRIRAKHEKEEEKKIPMLVFGLMDEINVRISEFDGAGPIHRMVMSEVGAIGWLAYNICHLNGRGKEFDRTILGAKFLLLHVEDKSSINAETIAALNDQIGHCKRANQKLKIFATPKVPIKGYEVTRIKDVEEISQYL